MQYVKDNLLSSVSKTSGTDSAAHNDTLYSS